MSTVTSTRNRRNTHKVLVDPRAESLSALSLADRVYRAMSKQILAGHLLSGDIINRKDIAKELNVSLAPVGEALIRLTADGFLETSPRRHTRVRIVRKADVRGQFALRLALERQAVSMAYGGPVRQARQRLLELAREVDRFVPKDPAAWPAEIAFHQALVELADCPELSAAYERVMRRNYFFGINSAHVPIRKKEHAGGQHSRLVDDLCTDDMAAAERAVLAHYSDDMTVLLRSTKS